MSYFNKALIDKLNSATLAEDDKKEFEYQVNEVLESALKQKDGISTFINLAEILELNTYKFLETTYYEDNAEDNNETLGENCEERLYYYFAREKDRSFRKLQKKLFNGHGKHYASPRDASISEYLQAVKNGAKEIIPVDFIPNTDEFIAAIYELTKDKKFERELTEVINFLNVKDLEEPAF